MIIPLSQASPVAHWLFSGSDAGAERAAVIYSLAATRKLHHIDPFAYLRDVLDRVSTHPASRIADLTPSGWQSRACEALDYVGCIPRRPGVIGCRPVPNLG
ncbi:MAG: transposase domain-containing protein [Phycisphaerales bacterium]|nr:MAG: transposase domain-containing protein [Phycisphaerales bacterium]